MGFPLLPLPPLKGEREYPASSFFSPSPPRSSSSSLSLSLSVSSTVAEFPLASSPSSLRHPLHLGKCTPHHRHGIIRCESESESALLGTLRMHAHCRSHFITTAPSLAPSSLQPFTPKPQPHPTTSSSTPPCRPNAAIMIISIVLEKPVYIKADTQIVLGFIV